MTKACRKKVVVVAPNWLGDAVMSLPLLGLLGAAEGVSVCVLAPEYIARVYWGLEEIDELVVYARRDRVRRLAGLARTLRGLKAETAVVLPPSFSSALAPYLGGVKNRIGYDTDGRGVLLTDPVHSRRARESHLSGDFVELAKRALDRLGLESPVGFETPALKVSNAELEELNRLLSEHGIENRYAVVVPGAAYGPAKSWPWKNYRELAGALSGEITVVLAGSGVEREGGDKISGQNKRVHNLCGETTMGQLFALLARSRLVIANDSGVPHAAAALGVPVVVLFGSTSPAWTAPLGEAVTVVQKPVHCSPCFRRECPTALECFTGIEAGEVLQRARAAMS